jgi:hypothetical protein
VKTQAKSRSSDKAERWFCRCLWVVSFFVFLPVAAVAQLTHWHWKPWSPGADGYQSAVREASSIADVIVGQSLSGY